MRLLPALLATLLLAPLALADAGGWRLDDAEGDASALGEGYAPLVGLPCPATDYLWATLAEADGALEATLAVADVSHDCNPDASGDWPVYQFRYATPAWYRVEGEVELSAGFAWVWYKVCEEVQGGFMCSYGGYQGGAVDAGASTFSFPLPTADGPVTGLAFSSGAPHCANSGGECEPAAHPVGYGDRMPDAGGATYGG